MIDSELIKEKTKLNLKENNRKEIFYILDYNFWKNYIEKNNMTEIYNDINQKKIVPFSVNPLLLNGM